MDRVLGIDIEIRHIIFGEGGMSAVIIKNLVAAHLYNLAFTRYTLKLLFNEIIISLG